MTDAEPLGLGDAPDGLGELHAAFLEALGLPELPRPVRLDELPVIAESGGMKFIDARSDAYVESLDRVLPLLMSGPTLGPKNLARRLDDAARGCTPELEILIPLTVIATVQGYMDPLTHDYAHAIGLAHLALTDRVVRMTKAIWERSCEKIPLLRGHVDPLLSWLDDATDDDAAALSRCFGVVAEVDMWKSSLCGHGGDLIGQVTAEMCRRHAIDDEHYPTVWEHAASLKTLAATIKPGDRYVDPFCQTGASAMGLATLLMEQGRDPSELSWWLGDPDDVHIALTAVNITMWSTFGDRVTLLSEKDAQRMAERKNAVSPPRRPPRRPQ